MSKTLQSRGRNGYPQRALAEEDEPKRAEDQDGEACADGEKREHRRAWLSLPRFPCRLDDMTVLFRCHARALPAIRDRVLSMPRQRRVCSDVPHS